MICWSEIEAEAGGFREGLVTVFRKYEGMTTDEVDGQGRAVKVSQSSFARHMGINEKTFQEWVRKASGRLAARSERAGSWSEREAKAAAKAKAEAEAKAAEALASALARQEKQAAEEARKAAEQAEKVKQAALAEAERKQKAALAKQAEEIRVAERSQAKAEAQKKLQDIEAKLRAEIKAEPPTPEVLAAMASQALTSSDPNIVSKMAEAYGKHRVEQDAKNRSDAKARASAARAAQAERDAKNAEKRASLEYEDSALKLMVDAHEILQEANALMKRKPISFSNIIASGLTVGEVEDMVEEDVEILKRGEAQILDATVENIHTN